MCIMRVVIAYGALDPEECISTDGSHTSQLAIVEHAMMVLGASPSSSRGIVFYVILFLYLLDFVSEDSHCHMEGQ